MKYIIIAAILTCSALAAGVQVSHKEVRIAKKQYLLYKRNYDMVPVMQSEAYDPLHSDPTWNDSARRELVEMHRLYWVGLKRIRHDKRFWNTKRS